MTPIDNALGKTIEAFKYIRRSLKNLKGILNFVADINRTEHKGNNNRRLVKLRGSHAKAVFS